MDRDFGHLIWQISSELSHLNGGGGAGGGVGGTDKLSNFTLHGHSSSEGHGGQGLGSISSPMHRTSTKSAMSVGTEKGGAGGHAMGVTTHPLNPY